MVMLNVPGAAGLREVVVTSLPERVVPGSIYAEPADPAAGGVEIRGVRFRNRPVEQDVREDVRKLDDQIRTVTDAQAANVRQKGLLAERKAYLDHLEQFTAPNE